MIRLLGRFCCRALQQVWDSSLRNHIESLIEDEDEFVQSVSKSPNSEVVEIRI